MARNGQNPLALTTVRFNSLEMADFIRKMIEKNYGRLPDSAYIKGYCEGYKSMLVGSEWDPEKLS